MNFTPKIRQKIEFSLHFLVISCFFYAQFLNLHNAEAAFTDEGVYAQAGSLIMDGLIPHRDFPLWHMPLLPWFIGITLKLTGEMYYVRTLFLFLNCLAVFPLYLTFREIRKNIYAALFAVLFYLTFHEMVHHDFRFVAIRQLANDLWIVFFYLGVVHKQWKYTPIIQSTI
jgi:hypothetical protein